MGFAHLARSGLLNVETPDLGDLILEPIKESRAYCSSQRCCKYNDINGKLRFKIRTLKTLKRGTDICPDCGYFLMWRKK